MRTTTVFLTLLAGIALAGCGGGPSEADYVAACLVEGSADKAQCECGAREAKSRLSATAFEGMVLEMSGKHREASEIMGKLSDEEQMETIEATLEIFGACVMGE